MSTRKPHPLLVLVLVGAALGLFFATFSTADFARHLDRQVHSVSCSFTPGLSAAESSQGCRETMFSAYSSILRGEVWGGIPISLLAMSVFAFLLLFGIELCLTGRQADSRATGFLALATALPALASLVMATISFGTLGAACKLCIGIYFSSAVALVGGIALWRRAAKHPHLPRARDVRTGSPARGADPGQAAGRDDGDPAWATKSSQDSADPLASTMLAGGPSVDEVTIEAERRRRELGTVAARPAAKVPWGYLAAAFSVGVALVFAPALVYAALAPDHSRFIGTCGGLAEDKDAYGVMVPLDKHPQGVPSIEVLDPMCPQCRLFEKRVDASGMGAELNRMALLFPLNNECNWMIDTRYHPGACAISEAVLCAGDGAREVIDWAFAEQEAIKTAAATSDEPARAMAKQRFPKLASCIGSATAKSKLNKSLRWGVKNQLALLTPQLFVNGVRMCEEDTDLGFDYTMRRMLDRARAGTLSVGGDK